MIHVLLSVVGMSPAVVTETLYAIQRDNLPWPDEIRIITTRAGKQKLLNSENNIIKHVNRLCHDYDKPVFSSASLLVLETPDARGKPVDDARSIEDHEALADFIMSQVCDVSDDKETQIHASIAGGRKTMTFYLGYAMSLFGRNQDRLSHVLVSEPFEQAPDFYYPTPASYHITQRSGETLDAADAEVVLADIPFIRLRKNMPPAMLSMGTAISFKKMVALNNIGEQEKYRPSIHLELSTSKPELTMKDENNNEIEKLTMPNPFRYAFWLSIVRLFLNGEAVFVSKKEGASTDFISEVLENHLRVVGHEAQNIPPMQMLELIEEINDKNLRPDPRTIEAIRNSDGKGMSYQQFHTHLDAIKRIFREKFPESLSQWLVPEQMLNAEGQLLDFYSEEWPKKLKGGAYGIPLNKDRILFKD